MAVSWGAAGTTVYSTGNPAPAYPSGITAGDLLILLVGTKPSTTPATTPAGWTNLAAATGAGGTGTTGIDTGPMRVGVFYKVADGTESGTLTVTVTGNNVSAAQIVRLANGTDTWDLAGALLDDTTTGTTFTGSGALSGDVATGDLFLACGVIPTDVTTPSQFSAESFTVSGVTFGSVTELAEWDTSSGQDMGGVVFYASATAGSASGTPTVTASATAGGTTTNVAGPIAVIRIREATAPATTNLIPQYDDQSFEGGAGSWIANGGATSVTQSATQSRDGAYSLKVVASSTADAYAAQAYSTAVMAPVTAGNTYTLLISVWNGNTSNLNFYAAIRWYNSAGTYLSTSDNGYDPVASQAWSDTMLVATAPANAAYGHIRVAIAGNAGADSYLDRVGVFAGTVYPGQFTYSGSATPKSGSDTATGTDAVTARAVTGADTASGTDGPTARAAASADTGTATDTTAALAAAVTGADTATGTDALGSLEQTVPKSASDTATATEAVTARTVGSGDTASGSDTAAARAAAATDTATAVDTGGVAAGLASSDTAGGTESTSARALTSTDTATGTDAVGSLDAGSTPVTAADTATGTDGVLSLVVTVTATDLAAAADTVATRALAALDVAVLDDTVAARGVAGADSAAVVDAVTAAIADLYGVDTATAVDAGSVFVGPPVTRGAMRLRSRTGTDAGPTTPAGTSTALLDRPGPAAATSSNTDGMTVTQRPGTEMEAT